MADETKGHTPGEFRSTGVCVDARAGDGCWTSIGFASGRSDDSTPEEDAQADADAALFARSRLAPHDCGNPECPGVRVLRALEGAALELACYAGIDSAVEVALEDVRYVLALIGGKS